MSRALSTLFFALAFLLTASGYGAISSEDMSQVAGPRKFGRYVGAFLPSVLALAAAAYFHDKANAQVKEKKDDNDQPEWEE